MATIGSFKKVGNDFQGEIVTLSLQAKGVRIVAESSPSNDKAPSHRIFVGRAEIGAAWSKRSEEGRDYLSLKLDDPSLRGRDTAGVAFRHSSSNKLRKWCAVKEGSSSLSER